MMQAQESSALNPQTAEDFYSRGNLNAAEGDVDQAILDYTIAPKAPNREALIQGFREDAEKMLEQLKRGTDDSARQTVHAIFAEEPDDIVVVTVLVYYGDRSLDDENSL